MARTLRVEYAGARYHLMGRGNQSRDIFVSQEDVDLFMRCLGEVCQRNDIRVHAWCVMRNHYHLLAETPQGDLINAMKWFLGTFTQRYNARHKMGGHLFQGRYKSKIVDSTEPSYFRKVGDYIHLNPAKAGLVKPGELSHYTWSSYPLYLSVPTKRPDWLEVQDMLCACGLPGDSSKSRLAYQDYMDFRHQEIASKTLEPSQKTEWDRMERGWIHGGKQFRKRMLDCLAEAPDGRGRMAEDREQKRDMSQQAAESMTVKCLKHLKIRQDELLRRKKSDPCKMLIAGLLRHHYPVSAAWISDRLKMGHFTTVSRAVRFYDETSAGKWGRAKAKILKFIG